MGEICGTHEREVHTKLWQENLNRPLGGKKNLGINGRVILKWALNLERGVSIGLIWLKTGISCGTYEYDNGSSGLMGGRSAEGWTYIHDEGNRRIFPTFCCESARN
jgi:hypothetical protein